MKNLFALLVLLSTILATTSLQEPSVLSPVPQNEVFLGPVMPGQTMELTFARNTGLTGQARAIFWETATASLPNGIKAVSTLKGASLSLKFKIPENASGKYAFTVRMDGLKIGIIQPETVRFWLDVTQNSLYNADLKPEYKINAGESNKIPMKISSVSAASDTLTVTSTEGIPLGWFNRQPTYMRYISDREMTLDIKPFEEGVYPAIITVSRSSDGAVITQPTSFRVYPTIKSKLEAFGEGFSLTPVILQPFYSLLSFLGQL